MSANKVKKNVKKPQEIAKVNEEGKRYTEDTLRRVAEKLEVYPFHSERVEPCSDAKQAGRAAEMRSFKNDQSTSSSKGYHKTESEGPIPQKKSKRLNSASKVKNKEFLAVQGVFFKCPQLGSDILPEKEWKERIFKYLKRQSEIDKSNASCLMIHSLNGASETKKCIQTLETIINNIILHPTDDKYKKIRFMNKVFQEKISQSIGGIEFLESIGFVRKSDDLDDYFYYPHSKPDVPYLKEMLQLLNNTKPIKLELYRNASVLKPSQVKRKVDLPDDFYERTLEEIKQEQELRSINLEKALTLRTKEMRGSKKNTKNNYLYSLIRIRFPDGHILQGTFGTYETLKVLKKFVRESVIGYVGSFKLTTALGEQLAERDDNKSLNELNLMPAVMLTFVPSKVLPAGQSYFVSDLH